MRRVAVTSAVATLAASATLTHVSTADAATQRPGAAALQVALRAHGLYEDRIDGIIGPQTRAGLRLFQKQAGLPMTGRPGPRTRRALGRLGKPLLGRREIAVGAVGWDVSSLEFRLRSYGLSGARVDGHFDAATQAALQRFQRSAGLDADGIAGPHTVRALSTSARMRARAQVQVHVVEPGEGFITIAERYHVSPWRLARRNGLRLSSVIVPGQRLVLPGGATLAASGPQVSREEVRALLDRWAQYYGVDSALVRALAWMESGFQQDVVSSVGAVGVMQLLPETWAWVDADLIGEATPRSADGNVRAGVRYLQWQLDHFDGDVDLALAGWYQGARAVRQRGLFDDTKMFVATVRALYGTV